MAPWPLPWPLWIPPPLEKLFSPLLKPSATGKLKCKKIVTLYRDSNGDAQWVYLFLAREVDFLPRLVLFLLFAPREV